MARKFPFEFDFDEDADPVEELHRLRIASTKHFKTLEAMMEYHNSLPTAKEMLEELREEIAENKAKEAAATKAGAARVRTPKAKAATTAKTAKTGKASAHAGRRKAAKRLTPA